MSAEEHLEKLFGDSFRREMEQDENIIRSLPFFATALALAVTVLGYAGQKLPRASPHFGPIAVHLAFVLVVIISAEGRFETYAGG